MWVPYCSHWAHFALQTHCYISWQWWSWRQLPALGHTLYQLTWSALASAGIIHLYKQRNFLWWQKHVQRKWLCQYSPFPLAVLMWIVPSSSCPKMQLNPSTCLSPFDIKCVKRLNVRIWLLVCTDLTASGGTGEWESPPKCTIWQQCWCYKLNAIGSDQLNNIQSAIITFPSWAASSRWVDIQLPQSLPVNKGERHAQRKQRSKLVLDTTLRLNAALPLLKIFWTLQLSQ